jgi:hypothetical protein
MDHMSAPWPAHKGGEEFTRTTTPPWPTGKEPRWTPWPIRKEEYRWTSAHPSRFGARGVHVVESTP